MGKTVRGWTGLVVGLLILGQVPFESSAEAGWKEKLASLFWLGGSANTPSSPRVPLEPWKKPLLEGNTISNPKIRAILQDAETIHSENEKGFNALLEASLAGEVPAIKVLIQSGADPNRASTKNGMTPLMAAASSKSLEAVQELFAQGAKECVLTRDGAGWTPLMYAVRYGTLEISQALLANGAASSIHEKEKDGWNALMLACRYGTAEIVNQLIAHGAESDLNEMNDEGATSLIHAALNKNKEEGLAIMSMLQNSSFFEYEPHIRGAVRADRLDIADDLLEKYHEENLQKASEPKPEQGQPEANVEMQASPGADAVLEAHKPGPQKIFQDDCIICANPLGKTANSAPRFDGSPSIKKSVAITSCGHCFCNGCLETARERKNACPMCRKDLTEEDVYEARFY